MMNRSNSFVASLKWWPLQGHNNQSNTTAPQAATTTTATANNNNHHNNNGANIGIGIAHWHHHHHNNQHNNKTTFGSSVAVQKLRESKWFKRDEQRIFCAVVECGFIVEVRLNQMLATTTACHKITTNNEDDDDDDSGGGGGGNDSGIDIARRAQDENETPVTSWFGIVLCKTAKDHKPKPETIEIFSVKIRENGTFKMIKMSLEDIWNQGWELRINNFADKEKQAHNEKDIRNQVSFARKTKQSLWNNNKHFAYWCRYGSRQQDVRKRQVTTSATHVLLHLIN